jgi:hypothetical protein
MVNERGLDACGGQHLIKEPSCDETKTTRHSVHGVLPAFTAGDLWGSRAWRAGFGRL